VLSADKTNETNNTVCDITEKEEYYGGE